jgi:hypothetical protein
MMTTALAHMRLPKWLRNRERVLLAAACALLAAGCEGGLDSPLAPSAVGTPAPSGLGAALTPGGAVIGAQGAPLSVAMNDVGTSGYSGTCTLASGRSSLRFKAQGQGVPNTLISVHLVEVDTTLRSTQYAEVNGRGTFRTDQAREIVSFIPSGDFVYCLVQSVDGTPLAQSAQFQVP